VSTALAIAGVTAVLRDRLNDGLVNHNVAGVLGSTVTVSVLPPDKVVPGESSETSQLNLFLYQATPNPGWRNEGLPARDTGGRHRLSNPPLALNLHYLLSAYSGGDLHAEILLGYAMQLLHEYPVLTREMINTALNPSPDVGTDLPPALRALAGCGLAEQVEQLRITPESLNSEEMSKLWTAAQSSYRPTAAYQVSVVLIRAEKPTRTTMPVLSRGPVDPGTGRERGVVVTPDLVPPVPTITAVVPDDSQPVAQLGETVTVKGHHLDGANRALRLVNERFGVDESLAASGPSTPDEMSLIIPTARAGDFPVGVYDVRARLVKAGESDPRESNRLALVLAPTITNLPQAVVRDGNGDVNLTINFRPALQPGQSVILLLGQREVIPNAFTAPVSSLDFFIEDADAGQPLARLRVDGVESPAVDRSTEPPTFLDRRVTIT
jgi:hypothetical protein